MLEKFLLLISRLRRHSLLADQPVHHIAQRCEMVFDPGAVLGTRITDLRQIPGAVPPAAGRARDRTYNSRHTATPRLAGADKQRVKLVDHCGCI